MLTCRICSEPLFSFMTLNNVPSTTFKFSDVTVDLHLASCDFCGCVQLYDNVLSDNYMSVYRSMGISPSYLSDKTNKLKSIIRDYGLKEPMVEIGCGDGQLLEAINNLGVRCDGVEYGKDNLIKCRDKGFVAYNNLVSNYNAFFMFYFLEHIPNPQYFMRSVYNHLNYGAVGVIEVPNYDYIEKNNVWLEITVDHVIYYRERTLTHLLTGCGFNIERTYSDGLCLTVIVSKRYEDNTFFGMKNSINNDLVNFKLLVDKLGDFCVYGAGHYSQMMLTRLYKEYGILPKHIYDSNKEKCGNSICGVEIIHGDSIESDCNSVIIICGMYNDEVYDMLNGKRLFKEIIKWN